MSEELKNKITESGIITINLEKYLPSENVEVFDIKDYLFMGLILKEKEFRQHLKEIDLEKYKNKIIAVTCSADAIIPMWAYMLISSVLLPISVSVMMGTTEEVKKKILIENINKIDLHTYIDQRIVVKGCGENPIPEEAYLLITNKLMPIARSIMFGEPCSTVPIFKKSNK